MKSVDLNRSNNIQEEAEKKHNIPGYWTMRLASVLIDLGLTIVLFFVLVAGFNMSPLGDIQQGFYNTMMYKQMEYGTKVLVPGSEETLYEVVYITDENKKTYNDNFTFEDKNGKKFVTIENKDLKKNKTLYNEIKDEYQSSLNKDKKYTAAKFNFRLTKYGIRVISISITEFALILVIPLLTKRRSTIGQYIAGLRCVNSSIPTPARWYKILGRYFYVLIIELALPILTFLDVYAIIVVPIITYMIACFTKSKREIRDFVSCTRLIDNKSFDPYAID